MGKLAVKNSKDADAFIRGVDYALNKNHSQGSLLHKLFSARSLTLFGELPKESVEPYLSGLLIGTEITEGSGCIEKLGLGDEVTLVGSSHLSEVYEIALNRAGFNLRKATPESAAKGLFRVASSAGLVSEQ